MTPEELRARTKRFALDCIFLAREFPEDAAGSVIARQLIRCGTSVGANYRSACLAKSTSDMVSKLKIVEEEADEVGYWLELAHEAGMLSPGRVEPLMKEGDELLRIMTASVKTLRSRINP